MKEIDIRELFTDEELAKAKALHDAKIHGPAFIERALAEIIDPAMPRINEVTGQENDPRYMACVLEYVTTN